MFFLANVMVKYPRNVPVPMQAPPKRNNFNTTTANTGCLFWYPVNSMKETKAKKHCPTTKQQFTSL